MDMRQETSDFADESIGTSLVAGQPLLQIIQTPENAILSWPGALDFSSLDDEIVHDLPQALWSEAQHFSLGWRARHLSGNACFIVEAAERAQCNRSTSVPHQAAQLIHVNDFSSPAYKAIIAHPHIAYARFDFELDTMAGVARCAISAENPVYSSDTPTVSVMLDPGQAITGKLCALIMRHSAVVAADRCDTYHIASRVNSFIALHS